MEEEKKNVAGGFRFLSEEDAALARQEIKKVQYLKKYLEEQDFRVILQIYQKAVADRTFQTPTGLAFVDELRQRLLREGIEEEKLGLIPVYYDITPPRLKKTNAIAQETPAKNKEKTEEKTNKFAISIALNILLAVLVAGMFVVAMTGNNPNILNYKRAITNGFAAWEQELSNRENAVREKELELNGE